MRRPVSAVLLIAGLLLSLAVGAGPASAAPADPTAPAGAAAVAPVDVPTLVSLSPDRKAGTATLSWAPPVYYGSDPITGYRVARTGVDRDGTGPWSTVVPASARSFTFARLKDRTAYKFSVRAVTAAGWGTPAGAGISTDPAAAPGAPVAGQVSFIAGESATITWQPPAFHTGSAITGYRVARDGSDRDGTGAWSTTLPASARSFTFDRLGPVYYNATVQALTAKASSAPVTILMFPNGPPQVLQPVDGLKVAGKNSAAGTVTLSWTLGYAGNHSYPPTSFRVSRDGTDTTGEGAWSTDLPGDARTFTFRQLRRGVPYTFTVTGSVPWGGERSQTVTVTL